MDKTAETQEEMCIRDRDMTASILARDNKRPMWVFGLNEKDSIVNTVKGNFTGTKVTV